MDNVNSARISKNLLVLIISTGILITPSFSFEPILWIKEIALVSIVLSTFSIFYINRTQFNLEDRFCKVTILCLFVALLLNLFFSDIDVVTWLWGYFGRANGSLSYASFLTLMYLNLKVYNRAHSNRMLKAIWIVCSLNAIYMTLQLSGRDPIGWNVQETFGFLGNINFSSALIGIFCIIILWETNATQKYLFLLLKFALILYLVFLVWNSGSLQGLFMFAIGIQFRILQKIFEYRRIKNLEKIKYFLVVTMLALPYFVILVISSPKIFEGKFVQETMLFRRDYWAAAYQMFLDKPLFGVGIDNYGNYYRAYRSITASIDFDRVSNSAHSIFLDLLSGGGLTLLIPYLGLVFYVSYFAIKLIIKSGNISDQLIASIWFSMQIQNVLGIQTITLGVINWTCAGLILGISKSQVFFENEMSTSNQGKFKSSSNLRPRHLEQLKNNQKDMIRNLLSPRTYLLSGIFFVLGLLISTPPFVTDVTFNNHYVKNDLEAMTAVSSSKFGNQVLLSATLEKATLSDKGEESMQIAQLLTQKYARSYYGWDVLSKLKTTPVELRSQALRELRQIEPRYRS